MKYAIPPTPQASAAIVGSEERFPIRRIYCIGRNYAAHTREMGKDPDREPPFFFTKPADAAIDATKPVPYPPKTQELHFEVELVVALHSGGSNLDKSEAMAAVWGAGIGIDLTRRDIQAEAKKMGRPWDMSKGFDHSAVLGPLKPMAQLPALTSGRIWLDKNNERKQSGNLDEMIWPIAEHIALLSQEVCLSDGDLIMTGTPAGVGPVSKGDVIRAGVKGVGEIEFAVV